MLFGIGVDIVEIERFSAVYVRHGVRLKQKVFGSTELNDVLANVRDERAIASSLAARFAAKEAVIKALGGRAKGFRWQDIEVIRDQDGVPRVHLAGAIAIQAKELGVHQIMVSLAHSRKFAVAFVTAETA